MKFLLEEEFLSGWESLVYNVPGNIGEARPDD